MKLIKDKETIEIKDPVQLRAFKKAGWQEAPSEKSKDPDKDKK